jgi:hypothetical protein
LAAWYCYIKGKLHFASLFAILATFTKTYGILIVVPMLLDAVTHRRWRRIPLILVPAILVGVFVLLFGGQSLMERMILEINTATWSASPGGTGYFWVRDFVAPVFTFDRPVVLFDYWHCFALVFVVLMGGLAVYSAGTDWRLGVYSAGLFLVIVFFGFINGLIRYLSFVFPIWLSFRTRNPFILVPIVSLFYIHSLILWQQFLASHIPL